MNRHLRYALVFSIVVLAGNAVAYFVYQSKKKPPEPQSIQVPAETDSIKGLAQEQKRRGVAALKTSNYAQAIVAFEAAAKLDPADAEVPTLLEVARKLEAGEKRPPEPVVERAREPVVEAPPPEPPSVARERKSGRRREREGERPSEPEVEKALLLVTTIPEKLLIEVNGRPADMSPARVEVDPGTVRVVIKRGQEVLLDRKVNATPGAVVAIQEDFSAKQQEPPSTVEIAKDDSLNLLELVDRDSKAAAPKTPAPSSGPPRIVVYLPGRNGSTLEASLKRSMSGVEVRVVSRSADLREAIEKIGVDAVIAPPGVLIDHGLTPAIQGVSEGLNEEFVAASLEGEVQRSKLASMTLGVVDERGRKETIKFVSDLVGAPSPKLRRVRKVEDLLPLLQFKMVDAVLVRSRDFGTLESRTQQRLYTVALTAKEDPVAVAFASGSRRSAAERAVLSLGPQAKQELGVGKWASQ